MTVLEVDRRKPKLLNRVRRIKGQIDAVELAVDQNIGCSDVLQLIAATRGAINGLMVDVLEHHIQTGFVDTSLAPDSEHSHAAEELIGIIRSYLK
jgi:FrmR/RcnR family transcriptional regulator, repressor of frmRAB operon